PVGPALHGGRTERPHVDARALLAPQIPRVVMEQGWAEEPASGPAEAEGHLEDALHDAPGREHRRVPDDDADAAEQDDPNAEPGEEGLLDRGPRRLCGDEGAHAGVAGSSTVWTATADGSAR